jgi:undecaprenyl diphosphate synthase
VCTNYGGRAELVRAARRLAEAAVSGSLDPAAINEERFAAELHTAGEPDPDLLIRTSGERRISNFLLWQLAYAELHITDVLWPDFDREALEAALADYQSRQRRFGGIDARPSSQSR